MNWKTFVASHWKLVILLTQLGLFALVTIIVTPFGDIVDDPAGP